MKKNDWTAKEAKILVQWYPVYGMPEVRRRLRIAGYKRSMSAIYQSARRHGLRRLFFGEICADHGKNINTVNNRLLAGWSLHDALRTPTRGKRKCEAARRYRGII